MRPELKKGYSKFRERFEERVLNDHENRKALVAIGRRFLAETRELNRFYERKYYAAIERANAKLDELENRNI